MAELLLVTPQEITQNTVLGGNIDIDKYNFSIANIQLTVIEPLLGTELYDKIKTDVEADTLAGLYLELFEDFVKPIIINQTAGEYIEVSSYTVDNGGTYKHQAENEQVPDRKDIEFFANKYRNLSDIYIQRFQKWICKNDIPEYKTYQDEVNASKDVKLMGGWYFGISQDPNKWERYEGSRTCCNNNCKDNCHECDY